jgi:hypothetical protein
VLSVLLEPRRRHTDSFTSSDGIARNLRGTFSRTAPEERAVSQIPPTLPPVVSGHVAFKPHRATAVLVLGILSLVIGCVGWIMGIVAWMMANADLREMDSGVMDPHRPRHDASREDLRHDQRDHPHHLPGDLAGVDGGACSASSALPRRAAAVAEPLLCEFLEPFHGAFQRFHPFANANRASGLPSAGWS